MECGGKIRFVGGIKHNQVIHVARWHRFIRVPIPRKLLAIKSPSSPIQMADMVLKTCEYELTPMSAATDCHYYEYVLCGHKPDEGPRHWRISNEATFKCNRFLRTCQQKLDRVIAQILTG